MLGATIAAIIAVNNVVLLPTMTWQPSREKRPEALNLEPIITKKRAVILVPGLKLHPINPDLSTEPEIHDWQRKDAALVKALSDDFDVYAIGYAQTLPLDAVSLSSGLHSQIRTLKTAGYQEITLIGHSAGGVIAKQFIEQFPKAGVTKVIQVASPNGGSNLANIGFGLPKPQIPFIKSMTPEFRTRILARSKSLPEGVQFACVVCKAGRLGSDTVVALNSQWPEELQQQGVPVGLVMSNHFTAMKDPESVKIISELTREKLVRWDDDQVKKTRKVLFDTSFGKGLGLGIIK